jgi:S1-C subfamily serine protease
VTAPRVAALAVAALLAAGCGGGGSRSGGGGGADGRGGGSGGGNGSVDVGRSATGEAHDPAVVSVTIGSGPAPADVATGFVTGRGHVVTVAHVLRDGDVVRVTPPTGRARRARVVRVDRRLDLALLAAPGLRAARAVLRRADGAVRVLLRRDGALRPLPATIRRHIIARVQAAAGGRPSIRPALELAAPILAGDSGAPVVDARGRIAAVVFARSDRRPGIAYAVDAPALAAFLRAR